MALSGQRRCTCAADWGLVLVRGDSLLHALLTALRALVSIPPRLQPQPPAGQTWPVAPKCKKLKHPPDCCELHVITPVTILMSSPVLGVSTTFMLCWSNLSYYADAYSRHRMDLQEDCRERLQAIRLGKSKSEP